VLFSEDFNDPDKAQFPRSSDAPGLYERGHEGGEYILRSAAPFRQASAEVPGTYSDTSLAIEGPSRSASRTTPSAAWVGCARSPRPPV
jgi:hypothetical protein